MKLFLTTSSWGSFFLFFFKQEDFFAEISHGGSAATVLDFELNQVAFSKYQSHNSCFRGLLRYRSEWSHNSCKKDKKSDLFNPTITLTDCCVSKREYLCNMSSRDNRNVAWEVSVGNLLHLQPYDTNIENRKWKAPKQRVRQTMAFLWW